MSNNSPRRWILASGWLAVIAVSGCKTLVPYESTFMCEKSRDFGRCMDVQSAYGDALAKTGTPSEKSTAPNRDPQEWTYPGTRWPSAQNLPRRRKKTKPETAQSPGKVQTALALNPADVYRDLEYRELAGLIENPVTPVVRPPKVLRTLIVSYTAADSLYMPRYVFYVADEARFVIGDYLNPIDERPTVYPNGRRTAAE